jgi:hypothetical protein
LTHFWAVFWLSAAISAGQHLFSFHERSIAEGTIMQIRRMSLGNRNKKLKNLQLLGQVSSPQSTASSRACAPSAQHGFALSLLQTVATVRKDLVNHTISIHAGMRP